jgi:hypothetical protein
MATAGALQVFEGACHAFDEAHSAALEVYRDDTAGARSAFAEACRVHLEVTGGPRGIYDRAIDRMTRQLDPEEVTPWPGGPTSDTWRAYLAAVAEHREAFATVTASDTAELARADIAYTEAIAGPLEAYTEAVAEARAPFTAARLIYEAAIAGPRCAYETALAEAWRHSHQWH